MDNIEQAKVKIKNNKARELVRDMCIYTAKSVPSQADRAMALADAFDVWASDEWIEKVGNGTMAGKEWIRKAICNGFTIPK